MPYIFVSLYITIQLLRNSRKISLTIKNYSQSILENPKVYFRAGTAPSGIPNAKLSNYKGLAWGARKTEYSNIGTAGVIVYQIKGQNKSLAVMWSIPFAYAGYRNWWNVKVYEGLKEANRGNTIKS